MRIDILSIFPDMFAPVLNESIINKAQQKKITSIHVHNLRNWATDKHQITDDRPFGGGPGMVMKIEPIDRALTELKQQSSNSNTILLSPQGETYTQKKAYSLTKQEHLILICGRYEGVDERVRSLVDQEISIGDYVLTGGELPAMIIVDSVLRLLPGVLGNQDSLEHETHTGDLIDYPQYTQPRKYKGKFVPEILFSGHHKKISQWRLEQSQKKTKTKNVI